MMHHRDRRKTGRVTIRDHSQAGGALLNLLVAIGLIAILATAWFWFFLAWNYSTGERAGWIQKFSQKGWVCKTWEGEMAMVTMPGTAQEKFLFTVRDDAVAEKINKVMGKRVALHYQEKVGLPTSCFGETRHYVNGVVPIEEIPLAPGIVVPVPVPAPAPSPAASPPVAVPAK